MMRTVRSARRRTLKELASDVVAAACRAAAVALCLAVPLARAEHPTAPTPLRKWSHLDRDADGRVTAEEFGGSEAEFRFLDKDGDGAVTATELPRTLDRHNPHRGDLEEDGVLLRDVVYSRPGDVTLTLDALYLRSAMRPMPVLVWIHGGGWRRGTKRAGAERLLPFARRGYFCATLDYRLASEAAFPAQIHDCKAAIRFLRAHADEYGIAPDRIGVWGSSAGGHLAALLGTSGDIAELEGEGGWAGYSSRVQAVCVWYGPSDLLAVEEDDPGHELVEGLLGQSLADGAREAAAASPLTYVSPDDPPFLLVHGTDDPLVPYGQSVRFRNVLRAAGVRAWLIALRGAGHGGESFRARRVRKKVFMFFEQYLGR